MSLISIFLSYTAVAPVWRLPPAGALAPAGPGQAFALSPCLPGTYEVASAGLANGDRTTRREKAPPIDGAVNSTTQTQTLDQRVVALVVPGLEIVE